MGVPGSVIPGSREEPCLPGGAGRCP